jgi:hypothetical protein
MRLGHRRQQVVEAVVGEDGAQEPQHFGGWRPAPGVIAPLRGERSLEPDAVPEVGHAVPVSQVIRVPPKLEPPRKARSQGESFLT